MFELKRLQENIQRLLDAGYTDELVDEFIEDSCNLEELNDSIEEELSYSE